MSCIRSDTIAADGPHTELSRLADDHLLTLIERGDAAAFEVLYDRHSRTAYSLALRLLRDRHSAEDLVQESFLAAWRGAGSYASARGSVRTWLVTIVHNRGVDRLRALSAMARRQEALNQMELHRPDEPDAAERGMDRILATTIRDELAGLPEEQRQVLELGYYGGFTHREISQMLSVPIGTVKSRMRLALERLRLGFGVAGMPTT